MLPPVVHVSVSLVIGCVPSGADTAFTHVELVPMDREHVVSDQTVLVSDGHIREIGPSGELAVPEGFQEIDGSGRFLMPGLADMHVHSWFPREHLLFLASGVTTVRNMFGSPMHLIWRDEIARGERLGPTFYTAGPIVDGEPAFWPNSLECISAAEGRGAVDLHVDEGYDFVKVYTGLPAEAFAEVVAAAREAGLPVMGHVPAAVGLIPVLEAGQRTIEHLSEYPQQLVDEATLGQRAAAMPMGLDLWEHADPERFVALVERTRGAGVWNCPTLVVLQKWLSPEEIELELNRPHLRFVSPWTVAGWRAMAARTPANVREATRRGDAARKAFTAALHRGGARLLLGTDMGNPFVAAGYSVHWELANFVEAGLSPYEALRTGTFEAAAFMDALDEFGTIAAGRRADLLLLEANPLEDVGNVRLIAGVMVRGRWLPRAELDERLEQLASPASSESPGPAGEEPAESGGERDR